MKLADVYEVDRGRIPEYFSDFYERCFALWSNFRLFGLPYAGGWAEQPARVIDILRTCEIENRRRGKK